MFEDDEIEEDSMISEDEQVEDTSDDDDFFGSNSEEPEEIEVPEEDSKANKRIQSLIKDNKNKDKKISEFEQKIQALDTKIELLLNLKKQVEVPEEPQFASEYEELKHLISKTDSNAEAKLKKMLEDLQKTSQVTKQRQRVLSSALEGLEGDTRERARELASLMLEKRPEATSDQIKKGLKRYLGDAVSYVDKKKADAAKTSSFKSKGSVLPGVKGKNDDIDSATDAQNVRRLIDAKLANLAKNL